MAGKAVLKTDPRMPAVPPVFSGGFCEEGVCAQFWQTYRRREQRKPGRWPRNLGGNRLELMKGAFMYEDVV